MIVFSFPSSRVVGSVKAPVTEMISLLTAPTQDCLVDLPSWELEYEDTATGSSVSLLLNNAVTTIPKRSTSLPIFGL